MRVSESVQHLATPFSRMDRMHVIYWELDRHMGVLLAAAILTLVITGELRNALILDTEVVILFTYSFLSAIIGILVLLVSG